MQSPVLSPSRHLLLSIIFFFGAAAGTLSAYQTTYIDVTSSVSDGAQPQVTFSWDTQKTGIQVEIARRLMGTEGGSATWELRGTVSYPTATFTDTVEKGQIYEYRLHRPATASDEVSAYVAVTVDPPVVHDRGKLILVVDKTMTTALARELKVLEDDLAGDGWTVLRLDYDRHGTGTPAGLKAAIQSLYAADPDNTKALYLFGRLPILKSGYIAPDGHSVTSRATDGYYAEFDGAWTDVGTYGTVNLPGDGIMDNSKYPAPLKLMVGRVDLAGMTSFTKDETSLLRDYIYKAHAYREGLRTELTWRSLWSSTYLWQERNWLTAMMGGPAYVTKATFQPTLATQPHIFGIDFGNWDGASADYTTSPNKLIFGVNFGSGKLDWNNDNNAMRSLLAQPDWGLTCVWGSRPAWFFHHTGAGYPIGYSALRTMNNDSTGSANFSRSNYFPVGDYTSMVNYVSNNLMGDPTLRLDPVAPPRNVRVTRLGGPNGVEWDASTDPAVSGYYVYRASSRLGPYTCLNPDEPATGTTFPDVTAPFGELYYQVRAVKRITHPAAIYPVTSQGAFGWMKSDSVSINHAPTASDGSLTVAIGGMVPVVFSGSDEDGDTITPILVKSPENGRLVYNGSQYVYVANTGFQGTDVIGFVMSDGVATSEYHTVTLNVTQTPVLAWEFQEPLVNVTQTLTSTSNAQDIAQAAISLGTYSGFVLKINDATLQSDAICLTGQATTQKNATCYLEWTVTPEEGATFSLSTIGFGLWNQLAATYNAELRWSVDGFATSSPVTFGSGTTISINNTRTSVLGGIPFAADLSSVSALQNRTGPVTFRLYLWYTSTRGSGGIGKLGVSANDLVVAGTVLPSSGYTVWRTAISWNGQDSSKEADPDGDGMSNMLEFLMGKDPLNPDTPYLSAEQIEDSGKKYLAVTFTRRISDRDLLTAQVSTDLVNWNAATVDGSSLIEELTDPDTLDNGTVETVRYKLLLEDGAVQKYLRLRTP